MAPTAIFQALSVDDAKTRRAELLGRLSITEHELRERAARYELAANELATLDEVDNLDYLLGEVD
ncbi:hypothetical protein [Occultella kanbiaonis]|uniref:hypothetical protein n=1 Tax=Occultella kanbiaonis TaxID=2675754 RepID=UPI0012B9DE90|nr:hypothetical protein [Occultella kanbiaonis]